MSSTFFIFFEKTFYPLRRNGFSRFPLWMMMIYTLYIRWVNPSIKKKFAFLSPYIYSIPYRYMFCQVLTVNSPKLFTVCTNSTFCNFLCLKCLFVRQKMPLPELFGAFCAKQRKSACSFVQGASQKINGGSTLLPGTSPYIPACEV